MDLSAAFNQDIVAGPVSLNAPESALSTVRIMDAARAAKVGLTRESALPTAIGRIDRQELRERVRKAMARNLPTSLHCINVAREWAVIGGGPSINDHVDTIRKLKQRGVAIVSVNKSHDWLLERGIVPWGHVLLDPKDWVAGYVQRPRKDVRYFVASQCHDDTFEALSGFPVFLWHAGQDFPEDGTNEPDAMLRAEYPGSTWQITAGATTVGLRTPMLGHHMVPGADRFHMIGFDSSRTEGKLHGYEKTEAQDAGSGLQKLHYQGRKYCFDTNSHMARQFQDFDKLILDLQSHYDQGKLRKSFGMRFYGKGLLPFYAATIGLHADPECNKDPTKVGGYVQVEDMSGLVIGQAVKPVRTVADVVVPQSLLAYAAKFVIQ